MGQVIFVFSLWDRDEMSNFYRRPSIVASYQVSVNLANEKQKSSVATMFANGSGRND